MKTNHLFLSATLLIAACGLSSCGEDLEKADYDRVPAATTAPTVITEDVEIYGNVVKATFNMTVPEGTTVVGQGFVVGTDPDLPLTGDNTTLHKIAQVTPGTPATIAIQGLQTGTTYYVRAYATTPSGIAYGETKSVVATDDYEYATDAAVDFTDMTGADAALFTTVKLGETLNPFTPVSMGIVGMAQWGFSSSCLSPDLFSTAKASIVSPEEDNLLTYKANLTGLAFPRVVVEGVNLAALFGDSYATYPGDFDVLVSREPITNAEELAAATVIGSCKFPTDSEASNYELDIVTGAIPLEYDGECYITIHNHSVFGEESGNLGVVITAFGIESLHQKAGIH